MAFAQNGTCSIYYETFGDPTKDTLVLVNGLGNQSINYKTEWCQMFVDAGLHVVRFDNRDVGLSSSFADAPKGAKGECYTVKDMAADIVGVLDALGVPKAHIMGLSMGGMIVQVFGIEHPDRALSIISVMSRTSELEYGQATERAMELLTQAPAKSRDEYLQQWVDGLYCWGSPGCRDEAQWRIDAGLAYDRAFRPDGVSRQFFGIRASDDRVEGLRNFKVPMLVMHGDADTLIDISGGRRTAELVPGAKFVCLDGMGHDYPPQYWPIWTSTVVEFIGSLKK